MSADDLMLLCVAHNILLTFLRLSLLPVIPAGSSSTPSSYQSQLEDTHPFSLENLQVSGEAKSWIWVSGNYGCLPPP